MFRSEENESWITLVLRILGVLVAVAGLILLITSIATHNHQGSGIWGAVITIIGLILMFRF